MNYDIPKPESEIWNKILKDEYVFDKLTLQLLANRVKMKIELGRCTQSEGREELYAFFKKFEAVHGKDLEQFVK